MIESQKMQNAEFMKIVDSKALVSEPDLYENPRVETRLMKAKMIQSAESSASDAFAFDDESDESHWQQMVCI